jgi:signal transduction histidine kinase
VKLKLLSKTIIYYILVALLIFGVGTAVFYLNMKHIMDEDATEKLHAEAAQVTQSLDRLGKVPEQLITIGDKIMIMPVSDIKPAVLRDTLIYDKEEAEELRYRVYTFSHAVDSRTYEITISHALFESDELIAPVIKSMLGILAALLAGMLLISQWISKKLWRPFYTALDKLKNYSLAQDPMKSTGKSGILEFDELDAALARMTDKIQADYNSLKSFTENASHEIQTPLAVIKSKLEILIQSNNLGEEQMKLIRDVFENANRLSKLNQALILLTRIGNQQYPETKTIRLDELAEGKLNHFEELIQLKEIVVTKDFKEVPEVSMNPVLADVLITNLIGNAIKHNIRKGQLSVKTTTHGLTISNSGEALTSPAFELFDRFRKENAGSDSLGLGLAIVRQICETSSIQITYTSEDRVHTLVLNSRA